MKFVYGSRASSVLYNWLMANKIKGKVLVPANICVSVPATYLKAGLDVVFCDIDRLFFQPDYLAIENILNTNSDMQVLHYDHTYGYRAEIDDIIIDNIKRTYPDIVLIDDCCLSVPKLNMFIANLT